ncbi:unnamed protein product, partial [Symbiodinium sp. KB8]
FVLGKCDSVQLFIQRGGAGLRRWGPRSQETGETCRRIRGRRSTTTSCRPSCGYGFDGGRGT